MIQLLVKLISTIHSEQGLLDSCVLTVLGATIIVSHPISSPDMWCNSEPVYNKDV